MKTIVNILVNQFLAQNNVTNNITPRATDAIFEAKGLNPQKINNAPINDDPRYPVISM